MFLRRTDLSAKSEARLRWPLECITNSSAVLLASIYSEFDTEPKAGTMSNKQEKGLPINPRSMFVIGVTSPWGRVITAVVLVALLTTSCFALLASGKQTDTVRAKVEG